MRGGPWMSVVSVRGGGWRAASRSPWRFKSLQRVNTTQPRKAYNRAASRIRRANKIMSITPNIITPKSLQARGFQQVIPGYTPPADNFPRHTQVVHLPAG